MAVKAQLRLGRDDWSAHGKHKGLIVHDSDPPNAEPPLALLGREFLTPCELFYVRSHGTVPEVDASQWRLAVDGLVNHELSLSLPELRERFPRRTVTAALHCAGNRRLALVAVNEIPDEAPWREGALGTAQWTGVALREVLQAAGLEDGAVHVAFSGLDEVEEDGERFAFGGSIPLAKALSDEVLLADEMNGAPLPLLHGFPLRVIVPGYIGARSVKWLRAIRVQREPSENFFQRRSYRLFAPDVGPSEVEWEQGLMLGELSVNAVICRPSEGDSVAPGPVAVEGYAIAGGPRWVHRVDLSADAGRTWTDAQLLEPDESWAWRLWCAEVELEPGEREIVVRAVESSANVQPEQPDSLWNFKGYVNNAWHRVQVRVGER